LRFYDRLLGGFALSLVIGIPLATIIVFSRLAERVLYPPMIAFQAIPKVLRSSRTGRLPHRVMRDAIGTELPAALNEAIVVNDPGAVSQAALLSLGVALISVPEALPYLESSALVRLVPSWYADLGPISLYYATRTLLPAKTRVFVDFVLEAFRRDRLAERFAGSLG